MPKYGFSVIRVCPYQQSDLSVDQVIVSSANEVQLLMHGLKLTVDYLWRIQDPAKHPRCSFLQKILKPLKSFCKKILNPLDILVKSTNLYV